MEKGIKDFYTTFKVIDTVKDSVKEYMETRDENPGVVLADYLPLEHIPTISNIDSKYTKKEIDEEIWKRYSLLS